MTSCFEIMRRDFSRMDENKNKAFDMNKVYVDHFLIHFGLIVTSNVDLGYSLG